MRRGACSVCGRVGHYASTCPDEPAELAEARAALLAGAAELRRRGWTRAEWLAAPGTPATRGDCPTARPCPHLRCRYHLGRMAASSCALDVADGGARSCAEVARIVGTTKQAVSQLEARAVARARVLGLVLVGGAT